MTRISNYCFITSLLVLSQTAVADTATMVQTKQALQTLNTKISQLETNLHTAHDQHNKLDQELAMAEKNIRIGMRQLLVIEQDIARKTTRIQALQARSIALNEQLHTQQALLAKHIRARYMMGEYQPIQWILNQDSPYTTSQLLTYYQYIINARQTMIIAVQKTQKELVLNQQKWDQELKEQQHLQQQLHKHQQALEDNKRHHTKILQALNQDIDGKQQTLEEYQQNRRALSQLLKTLLQQSVIQSQHPLIYGNKKLPRPVGVNGHKVQPLNQGVVFFTPEGTPVTAVRGGNVVFSDWLRGYGLLLIIDHGQGFMTLYAHNHALFKQKGERVNEGEQIATVGHSGGLKENGLYFEIRQRGKAIPPLKWLS